MDYAQLVESLTPEMIERFTEAVATGKWPDGNPLTEQQLENCMQALMLYQAKHNEGEEPFTISRDGQLHTGKKVRSEFSGSTANSHKAIDTSQIIKTSTKE